MKPQYILLALIISLISLSNAKGQSNSLEDPSLNPWITPLDQCGIQKGSHQLDINMGFLNTDYFCRIDPKQGAIFLTKEKQSNERDAARLILQKIDSCQSLNSERILVGVSRDSLEQLQELLPNRPINSILQIGRTRGQWKPPETHAKVFQLSNGVDQFFTVHGSLNIQTVGLTCKANNALRFTESQPVLYNYFKELGDAVEVNSAKDKFNGLGNDNSSGTDLVPASIGSYQVQFYAGRDNGFVGASHPKNQVWPDNINPPVSNQHAPGIINWYDGVIYDAAKQLRQGRDVHIDVLIFEVGQENAFVSNLWRFVKNGFEGGRTENKAVVENLPSPFIGTLSVRFLWQFQSGKMHSGKTFDLLNGPNLIGNAVKSREAPTYSLEKARIWPIIDKSGIAINPGTPRDMHNKLVILEVKDHPEGNKLYVTSSNMDTPNIGSGKLWQAGTIISPKDVVQESNTTISPSPGLWTSYKRYFELLWSNREGQKNAGQIGFSQLINEKRKNGNINWIETIPNKSDPKQDIKEGIDAYFFPIPFE
jgi:hypothetical protein